MDDNNSDELGDWRRTHYSNQIHNLQEGEEITTFGWVEDIRDLGGIAFIKIRDREGLLQITIPKRKVPNNAVEKLRKIGKQYPLGIRGHVKLTKEALGGVEIIPSQIKILGVVKYPLPLDPTGRTPADIDVRLDARILDLRRPEQRAIFKIKQEAISKIRKYFINQGLVEVQTPRIIAAAAEGGSALFPVQYFSHDCYLAQSPELYKEQLITIFEKIFEIGPFFRAEESHTRRHLNEFISVDVEEAFASWLDMMDLHEKCVKNLIANLYTTCKKEFESLKVSYDPTQNNYKKYTYTQIIEELSDLEFEIKWGEDIPTPAYRLLGKKHKKEFYFIIDWPSHIRPFYIKPKKENPQLCDAFDFMYEWIEISSGGTRVDDKNTLIQRLREQDLNPEKFKFFTDTFDYGMPPHAGFGMGLDRLIMAILNIDNIREVVLFPRDRFRIIP